MFFVRAFVALAVAASSAAPGVAECAARPLAVSPSVVNIHATSILEGLVALGQPNSVCFGVEVADDQLAVAGVIWTTPAPVGELLAPALSARSYELRGIGKVIHVSPRKKAPGDWLDTRIPRFQCARAGVQTVSNVLFMTLRRVEDPTLRGFVGDYWPGDTRDQAGPFDERNRTLRELLDLIVISSKGGLWLAVGGRARGEGLASHPWMILEYSAPLSANLARMRGTANHVRFYWPKA
jgi:hypothetical protein